MDVLPEHPHPKSAGRTALGADVDVLIGYESRGDENLYFVAGPVCAAKMPGLLARLLLRRKRARAVPVRAASRPTDSEPRWPAPRVDVFTEALHTHACFACRAARTVRCGASRASTYVYGNLTGDRAACSKASLGALPRDSNCLLSSTLNHPTHNHQTCDPVTRPERRPSAPRRRRRSPCAYQRIVGALARRDGNAALGRVRTRRRSRSAIEPRKDGGALQGRSATIGLGGGFSELAMEGPMYCDTSWFWRVEN
jgi:hypothetical protein